jgi:HEAT repeat protein
MPDSEHDDQSGDTDDVDLSRIFSSLQRSTDAETRQRAVKVLGNPSSSVTENKPQVVEKLIKTALTDDQDAVRAEAINSLYFHGNEYLDRLVTTIAKTTTEDGEAVVDTFTDWLTADYAEFRMVGATGIQRFSDGEVSSELEAALGDSDPRVQARAVRAYGELDADSLEPIRPLLRTYNSHVRHASITALTRIGTSEALRLVASATQSSDEDLRRIAVEHLYKLDTQKSAHVLLRSIQDPSPAVRQTALVSLIRLFTDGDAVRPGEICNVLVTDDSFDPEELVSILSDITTGSGSDHGTQATRRQACWLLGEVLDRLDDHDAVELLMAPFQDSDTTLADIAAAYLSRLPDAVVEKELQLLLKNNELSEAVETRAELVLDKIRRNTASMANDRSIEYTYVQHPSDYTEKHAQ